MNKISYFDMLWLAGEKFLDDKLKELMVKGEYDICIGVYPIYNRLVNTIINPIDINKHETFEQSLEDLSEVLSVLGIEVGKTEEDFESFKLYIVDSFLKDKDYYTINVDESQQCYYLFLRNK